MQQLSPSLTANGPTYPRQDSSIPSIANHLRFIRYIANGRIRTTCTCVARGDLVACLHNTYVVRVQERRTLENKLMQVADTKDRGISELHIKQLSDYKDFIQN